jgi:hypothetical protein
MEHAWQWAVAAVKREPAFTHELHVIRVAGSMRERLRQPHPARQAPAESARPAGALPIAGTIPRRGCSPTRRRG